MIFCAADGRIQSAVGIGLTRKALFTEHFGDDEDKECAAKSSSEKKIDERISNGANHGCERCDYHDLILHIFQVHCCFSSALSLSSGFHYIRKDARDGRFPQYAVDRICA